MSSEENNHNFTPAESKQNFFRGNKEIEQSAIRSRNVKAMIGGMMTLIPEEVHQSGFLKDEKFIDVLENFADLECTFNDWLDFSLSGKDSLGQETQLANERDTRAKRELDDSLLVLDNPAEAFRIKGLIEDSRRETEIIDNYIRTRGKDISVEESMKYRILAGTIFNCAAVSIILGREKTQQFTSHISDEDLNYENIYKKYEWIFEGRTNNKIERTVVIMERVASFMQIDDDWAGIDIDTALNVPSVAIVALNEFNGDRVKAAEKLKALRASIVEDTKKQGLGLLPTEGLSLATKLLYKASEIVVNATMEHYEFLSKFEKFRDRMGTPTFLQRERAYIRGEL